MSRHSAPNQSPNRHRVGMTIEATGLLDEASQQDLSRLGYGKVRNARVLDKSRLSRTKPRRSLGDNSAR